MIPYCSQFLWDHAFFDPKNRLDNFFECDFEVEGQKNDRTLAVTGGVSNVLVGCINTSSNFTMSMRSISFSLFFFHFHGFFSLQKFIIDFFFVVQWNTEFSRLHSSFIWYYTYINIDISCVKPWVNFCLEALKLFQRNKQEIIILLAHSLRFFFVFRFNTKSSVER